MSELWAYEPNAGFNSSTNSSQVLNSVTIAANAATASSSAIPGDSLTEHIRRQIQVANTTAVWAYVNFGRDINTINAATVANSFPIQPNWAIVVTVAPDVSAASVILASGTGNVTFTRGVGRL